MEFTFTSSEHNHWAGTICGERRLVGHDEDLAIESLDEAIEQGLAQEGERCEDLNCDWCHSFEATPIEPDGQRWPAVGDLNCIRLHALHSSEFPMLALRQGLTRAHETIRLRGKEIETLIAERDVYLRRFQLALEASREWQNLFEVAKSTRA